MTGAGRAGRVAGLLASLARCCRACLLGWGRLEEGVHDFGSGGEHWHRVSYTDQVASSSAPDDPRASLRAEQVAQTRAALVAAGRLLFGRSGFAATPVEDLVRAARVTTGALYHHLSLIHI